MADKPQPFSPAKLRLVFWLVLLAALGVALVLFLEPYLRTTQAPPQGAVVQISMSGWQPTVVKAKLGQPLTITMVNLDNSLHSDGGGWHNFVVEEFGVSERVPPKQTLSFSFTPTKAGEYLFYCDICCGGKENPFMQGRLVVSA
ncbi:MAG: cupredoxin domain-containing protein [Deinococcota bacterium]|nr:cupredoxin domain-containing protein [Allomeiothermus silvanus]